MRIASGLEPACRDSQQELKDRIRQAVALPVRIAIKGDCLETAHAWGPVTQTAQVCWLKQWYTQMSA